MREIASKAETVESTAGLLKIMDDIAGLRAAPLPPIAAGGYRMLNVRGHRPRPTRAAAISPLIRRPMRVRGFLTAVFAGGLGLAVLAGPATCPACDPAQTDGRLDAKRIVSRLTYTDGSADAAALETPAARTEDIVKPDAAEPPAQVALAEPDKPAAPIATAALGTPTEPVAETAPVTAAPSAEAPANVEPEARTVEQPEASPVKEPEARIAEEPENIEEVPARDPPRTEVAAATMESEPKTPLLPVGATTLPLKDIGAEDSFDSTPPSRAVHKHSAAKHSAAKARRIVPRNASAPKLYSPDKYHVVPRWAAKMYESPWQNKAFSFQ